MITELKGDVFKSKDDILIHGCNCYCVMGAGVARIVRKAYPSAYAVDKKTGVGDPSKMGKYTYSKQKHYCYPEQDIIVINAYTQYGYSWTSYKESVVDYDAIRTVMTSIKKDFPRKSISMPRIGAGLAGGDWKIISDIINDVFKKRKVTVYYLEEGQLT